MAKSTEALGEVMDGNDGEHLPGRHSPVGQHSAPMDGVEQKHLHHHVHGHIAHSPRSHFHHTHKK